MKFAANLAENMVPEWRGKYLEYRAGKKKIKKVAQQSHTSNLQTPGTTGRFSEFSLRPRLKATGTNANSTTGGGSFEQLPSPAIDPRETSPPKNDRTPLLEAQRPPVDQYHQQLQQRRFSLQHPATYSGGSIVQANENSVPLDNLRTSAIQEFTEWLDTELRKLENFYRMKEDHCVERFLLIQDQLYHLQEEKARMKARESTVQQPSHDVLKTGLAKTSQKLSKLNKYELPSLPKNLFRKPKKKTDDNGDDDDIDDEVDDDYIQGRAEGRRDYQRHKHKVPYYVARRQLKAVLQEFYRELELLKSYRMLNRTGFRKLLKKFDKQTHSDLSPSYMDKVNRSHFASSEILDNLLPKVEDLYSANFENGNRKIAVEKLRSNLKEDQYYTSMFMAGVFYGCSIPLFVYALYIGLHKTLDHELPEGRYLLQIWAGFFLLLLIAILFGINCFVWAKFKVNYRFIFELNPKYSLNYREYPFLPSIFLLLLSLIGWFSFNDFWPTKLPGRDWPWFFFGISLLVMICPFNIMFLSARKWLLATMCRLFLSGLYPVEFRDFFIGDIFCSLTYTMGNLSFFFCLYATHWKGSDQGNSVCGSSRSRLMGFFSTLPPLWRFLQCIRRYLDSGDWFPHLANMVKYAITMLYYITLSTYRIDRAMGNKAIFILFACMNSIYSALWDLFMDWSLMQNKWLLRDDLVYPVWFYYFAMISDVILRFQWIFYALFSQQVQQSAVTSFCVALAELFRRFIWMFIRMENEHVTNIHLFRASREAPLPYETIVRPIRRSRDQEADVGFEHIEPVASEHEPATPTPSLRRRATILDSALFQNVTKAIVHAHAKDFQRRKPDQQATDDPENSSDDDINSDNESTRS